MSARNKVLLAIVVANVLALLLPGSRPATADLNAIVSELWRNLPGKALERPMAPSPLVLRGRGNRAVSIYRNRVSGVVLIASNDAIGSGALISTRGDIVTAEHVVANAYRAEGAEWVLVWFKPRQGVEPDVRQALPAVVIYRDRKRDIALIRLARSHPRDAVVVPLARRIPEVGQDVFSIGHPEEFFWTFAQGVVSQIRPDYSWMYSDGTMRVATIIQTQTPTNPGSSGGPLFNEDGAMIGVIVGSVRGSPGLYLAVALPHIEALFQR